MYENTFSLYVFSCLVLRIVLFTMGLSVKLRLRPASKVYLPALSFAACRVSFQLVLD